MEFAELCCGVERNVVILLIVHVTKGGGLWCKRAKLQQAEGHCQFMFAFYNQSMLMELESWTQIERLGEVHSCSCSE